MSTKGPKIKWPKMPTLFKTKKGLEQEIADLAEQNRQLLIIKANLLRRLAHVPNPTDPQTITNLERHVARLQDIIIRGGADISVEHTIIFYGDGEMAARIADYQGFAAQIVGERRVAKDVAQQLRREKALTQRLRERIRRFKDVGRRHSV